MRIFVYEFITGGGLIDDSLPTSLTREGELMLRALLRDLHELPGVQVVTTRDRRLPLVSSPIEVFTPHDAREASALFCQCVDATDATWVVAPETDGILERISEQVLARNGCLLGSRPEAVRIAASKTRTAAALARYGVSVVPVLTPTRPIAPFPGRAVLKPDDGAGCVDTRVYESLGAALEAWEAGGRDRNVVLQPLVEGVPASLSLLVRSGRAEILSVNRQSIALEGCSLRFRGCTVNGLASWRASLAPLAQGIAEALAGLWGYVGVDFVLSDTGPIVLNVNPRLTTSYAGLREATGVNAAALVLHLLEDGAPMPAVPASLRCAEVSSELDHVGR